MTISKTSTVLLIVLGTTLLHSPIAAPAEPSIEQSMKDLQSQLTSLSESTTTILVDGETTPHTTITRYSNIVTNAQTCSIRYHETITNEGKVVRDANAELNLRTLRTFDVIYEARIANPAGGPGMKFVPPHLHLRAWGSTPLNLYFPDAAAAERVRSTFAHVIELCAKQK
jgi:hypothetical protein